jgi:hypothetical protein
LSCRREIWLAACLAIAVSGSGFAQDADTGGVDIGGFNLRGTQDVTARAIFYSAGGRDYFAQSETELRATSSSDRHELSVEIGTTAVLPKGTSGQLITDSSIVVDGRMNLSGSMALLTKLEAGRSYDDDPTSDSLNNVSKPGADDNFGGMIGLERTEGTIGFEIEGSAMRERYGAQTLDDNSTDDRSDQDRWVYGARARALYNSGAGLQPFIEGRYRLRLPDATVDSSGINRRASSYRGVAGVAYGADGALSGELSAGYERTVFSDATLTTLDTWVATASLRWAPDDRRFISLGASTAVDVGTSGSTSAVVRRGASLGFEQQVGARMTAGGEATVVREIYRGSGRADWVMAGSLTGSYNLTDNISVLAQTGYTRRISNRSKNNQSQVEVGVGVRLTY